MDIRKERKTITRESREEGNNELECRSKRNTQRGEREREMGEEYEGMRRDEG